MATLTGESMTTGGTPLAVCQPPVPPTDVAARFYAVQIPPGNLLTVAVNGVGIDPGLNAVSSCASTSCDVPSVNTLGNSERLVVRNTGAAARDVVVAVSTRTSGSGVFNLATSLIPIPANATCAATTPLAVATPLPSEVVTAGGPPPTPCLQGTPSPSATARFYSLTIPASTAVTVTAVGVAGFNPTLASLDTCSATTCAPTNRPGVTETLTLRNPDTAMSRSVVIALIDEAGTGGSAALSATSTPIAPNSTCATATAVTVGTPITGEAIASGGAPLSVCVPASPPRPNAVARYYSVSVPASSLVNFRVLATGFDPALATADACTSTMCGAFSDQPGLSETLVLRNESTMARTFQVGVVDPLGVGGTYTITTSLSSLATCSMPTTLTTGAALTNQDLSVGTAPPPGCPSTNTGPAQFYSVSVPAGETRQVRVVSTGMFFFNPSLAVVNSCTATSCVASRDVPGSIETLQVSNTGSTVATYVVVVGSPPMTTTGTFTISVTRPAYALSSVPQACADLTGAPDVAFTVGNGIPTYADDVATASTALPFTFPFFGVAMTHASYTSNGVMQVSVGVAMPLPVNAYGDPIPSPNPPNNLIAPFWDDMNGSLMIGTSLRFLTVGAMPNRRHVAQWASVAPYVGGVPGSTGPERVTFQVHLVETTNVIEFHYCSASSNGGTLGFETGSSAFIGIEDGTGSDQSVAISNSVAGAVSPMTAFRLTPQP